MGRTKKEISDETEEKDQKAKKKDDIYLSASYILEKPVQTISTGLPALDIELGGGWADGTISLILADPKLGKSILCFHGIASGQKLGRIGIYVGVEDRMANLQRNFQSVKGLDLSSDKLKIICSSEGNILSAEDYLERAERALIDFPGCVLCIDSFSALQTSNDRVNNYSDQSMGGSSKLQAKFVRRIAPIISVNRNIVLGIVHLAPNFSPYGGPTENVGKKLQYGYDIKIKGKKSQPFEWYDEDKNLIGQRVEWEVLNTALSVAKGGSCVSWLRYGEGFCPVMDIISLASDLGIIEKGGSWYTLPDGRKVQGSGDIYKILREEKELYNNIYSKVKDLLS